MPLKTCPTCNAEFRGKRTQTYCSTKCKPPIPCAWCEKLIFPTREYQRHRDIVCSEQCLREALTERKERLKEAEAYQRANSQRVRLLKYGLSPKQFEVILELQKHKCAVCGIAFDTKVRIRHPHIDHCHATGIVRGILCGRCNIAEGLLGSLKNAKRLVAYMEKNELFYSGLKRQKSRSAARQIPWETKSSRLFAP